MAAKKRTATKKAKKGAKKGTHIAYNGSNFSKILPHFKGPAVVINILVHMNGCGPCQRLMGPYKKAVSNAPADAVNVSVERQQLEKFNDDLRKSVPGASPLGPNGFPTIIKVNNSGKILSSVNPSPSNIGSLTANSPNSLNDAMEGVPSANSPINASSETNTMEEGNSSANNASEEVIANENSPMIPPEGEDSPDLDDEDEFPENEKRADGSMASVYNSQGNSPLMTGGRAYAMLTAAGHRLRKSKRNRKTGRKMGRKTGRKTRHRKTGRKTQKTHRRSYK